MRKNLSGSKRTEPLCHLGHKFFILIFNLHCSPLWFYPSLQLLKRKVLICSIVQEIPSEREAGVTFMKSLAAKVCPTLYLFKLCLQKFWFLFQILWVGLLVIVGINLWQEYCPALIHGPNCPQIHFCLLMCRLTGSWPWTFIVSGKELKYLSPWQDISTQMRTEVKIVNYYMLPHKYPFVWQVNVLVWRWRSTDLLPWKLQVGFSPLRFSEHYLTSKSSNRSEFRMSSDQDRQGGRTDFPFMSFQQYDRRLHLLEVTFTLGDDQIKAEHSKVW